VFFLCVSPLRRAYGRAGRAVPQRKKGTAARAAALARKALPQANVLRLAGLAVPAKAAAQRRAPSPEKDQNPQKTL